MTSHSSTPLSNNVKESIDVINAHLDEINNEIIELTKLGLSVYIDTCADHVLEDGTVINSWPMVDTLSNNLVKLMKVSRTESYYDGDHLAANLTDEPEDG